MALVLLDRVQQTGTANTTVSFTVTGSVAGYQSWSAVGNGNTTYYGASDASGNWEVGLATYSTTGPTVTRTAIFASSNAGAAVTFSGTVNVWVDYAAGKAVYIDANGNVSPLGTISSGIWQGTAIANSYLANSSITINGSAISLGGTVSVGTVTSVTATSPVASTGGATPVISMPAATTSVSGYLTSTDWNTFNGKQASLGFTPVQQGGGTGQGTNKIYIGWATSQLFLQVDATNFGATWPINISGTASNGITTTTGSAPYYGARAWINFNGSGGASIRASGNVNSVTRTGTGQYYMTFTTAMPDTSYCAQITIDSSSASSYQGDSNFGASSSSNFYFNTHDYGNSYVDNTYISVAIFR